MTSSEELFNLEHGLTETCPVCGFAMKNDGRPECSYRCWALKKRAGEVLCEFNDAPETSARTPGVILCLHPPRFLMLLPSDPNRLLKLCSTHYGFVAQDLHFSTYCAEML